MKKLVLILFTLFIAHQVNAASMEDALLLVAKNKSGQAISILDKMSREGNVEARYVLGRLLYYSATDSGTAKKGYDYILSAARDNSNDALLELGDIYYYGYFLKRDINKAFKYYTQAAENGNAQAQFNAGHLLISNEYIENRCEDGVLFLIQSDRKDYPEASEMLGKLYMSGNCVKKDVKKSIAYFEKVKDEIGGASFVLGGMCLDGSIECSDEEYFRYIKTSSELGYYEAITFLADCYFYGKGVTRDHLKALQLYKKGASLMVSSSMMRLFHLYNDGAFVAKDINLAQKYLRKAYRLGDKKAIEIVGKN